KYVFIVEPSATKNEIKKIIKKTFGVDAIKVNIINKEGKIKMFRNKAGRQINLKKAVVTLKEGQKINLGV
ncbi:MAG: 50S ribosomal protein L23, partial [Patescibacteria group bacterium]|nr:50S ribosomal protein L23 [Patescibacteria group bacterium]